ncbi:MAG: hypothetical protein J0M35_18870 [Candidatus Obscuribacter phosphatis]|uniref:Transmembrane protein n=1 Tax=Candidatus Obscuribacter phosphatis TaxID=1906157 RepID=A0A8J7TMR2_9BACT|nr:hypothetical protein [Candidatus Obscuribacter phosphatis]
MSKTTIAFAIFLSTALLPPVFSLPALSFEKVSTLSNAELLSGPPRRRHSSKPIFRPLPPYHAVANKREKRFVHLLLTSLGFVGIFLAVLALRSMPQKRY